MLRAGHVRPLPCYDRSPYDLLSNCFFFAYSFLGCGEVLFTAVVHRKYQDRGVLSGPLCILYGIGGLVITFALGDIREGWFFLFVFSAVYATVIEWIGGHILERTSHTRWWDYSAMPFNLDGYVRLGASLTWGALGVVVLKWGNPLLLALYSLVPRGICCCAAGRARRVLRRSGRHAAGYGGPALPLARRRGCRKPSGKPDRPRRHVDPDHVERRMAKAHPALTFARPERQQSGTFAAGCSPYKNYFTVLRRVPRRHHRDHFLPRHGRRVDEPFQRGVAVFHRVGLAIALVTQLLYRYKDKPASWLFVMGTLLGGAYEYLCSVFTEVVFGAVFWDYSAIPFNLGGRINLLYCFWGFAAVAWFKVLYPPISACIEKLPPAAAEC